MYSIFGIINPTNDGCKIMLCTIRIMYVFSIYSMCTMYTCVSAVVTKCTLVLIRQIIITPSIHSEFPSNRPHPPTISSP